jgi:hypothetical protein
VKSGTDPGAPLLPLALLLATFYVADASGSPMLEAQWCDLDLRTQLDDRLEVRACQDPVEIVMVIDGERFPVDRFLPARGDLVPGSINLLLDPKAITGGPHEADNLLRTAVLRVHEDVAGNDTEYEYRYTFDAASGYCRFEKFDAKGNSVEYHSFCDNL